MLNPKNLLSTGQVANILQIKECTVNILVKDNLIPHTYVQTDANSEYVLRFNPHVITGWLRNVSHLDIDSPDGYVDELKKTVQNQFPDALKMLKKIDSQYAGRQKKGYNLAKVKNKESGFLYYVRYIKNGKLIPSRWTTGTNSLELAEQFARENRDRLLSNYYRKKQPEYDLYKVLESYYENDSPYHQTDGQRGRKLGKKALSIHRNFIKKVAIPFLRENGVKKFTDVTAPLVVKLQDFLLRKMNKPQTVNSYIGGLAAIFDHLLIHGIITDNVFGKVDALKVAEQNYTVRGCHEINSVTGVFNKKWNDPASYLLCLVIYTTGMRNSEIERIKVSDIITIDNCRFINITDSKTRNGVRIVPLHDFVYKKLAGFIAKTGKKTDDLLFIFSINGKAKHNQSTLYKKANADMGVVMGLNDAELAEQHITFYSGRHYWKTLINSEDLGDIEEYFMGHKVSNNVAKRYNHRDKQGQEKILEKAREVLKILDKRLFEA
jgi:integrase